MARAPPLSPLYHLRPITFVPTQLLFPSPIRTKPRSISGIHVSSAATDAMPSHPEHHPSLEIIAGGGVGARDSVLLALKTLTRPYTPFPMIGWNRHMETIFASFFRSLPDVRLRRECLRTQDNGCVALDWVSGDHRHLPPESPLLILLPGLTGGSGDSYVRHMLVRARSKGWRVVVFNSRGCGDSPVTTPQEICVKWWSMLLLGTQKLIYMLLAGLLEQTFLFDIWVRHALLFEDMGGEYNIPLAANAKSVRDFDEGLTRVSFGFKSVDDYYSNSSSSDSIKHVRIPLLCIQAANDPIAPSRGIPREDIKENPNCLLIVTPQGGHLGWVAGVGAPLGAPWTDPVVMDFLEHLERGVSKGLASSVDLQQTSDVQKAFTG
ncbi:embryogenesis-associated protein EMB8-like isoform X2 [Juglans regia]|uniref:Embryogenesis-associated protein EMB8-like isoform X2 n=1 Tax=Juglans regia TaxID=51240 RepID=A0A6P9E5L0_JUGRE|nr:embryogenesis-associated protein EMB8-like isoform X2 [Juglans regia]